MNDNLKKSHSNSTAPCVSVDAIVRRRMYATIDWAANVCLCGEDGRVWGKIDRVLFPEYWKKNKHFPHDPQTGKPLTIYGGCNIAR